ncbi:hypothetical protein [Spiroplasma ixodetis]|uniref:Uncharacterized protein n=1 Tax=Spiroplasma ixodetis TaxID=2141 RepID=A0ABM8BW07_9MOLU|nr:hypothetical protein [Spiroplasma ixodetis]BDT03285.1 hypothetical protein SHM_09310 [Spiroplasma ixodetis]BDT03326.1 hypothetical protein SHM_09720 [Spiroplasma ixodetis]BDT04041.1 hypothetical protein SHM_16870 [Spiroplasma ixodetis]
MDNFYAYIPLILKYIVILPYFLKDSKQVLTNKEVKIYYLGKHYANKSSTKLWYFYGIDLTKLNLDLTTTYKGVGDGSTGEKEISARFISLKQLNKSNDALSLATYGKLTLKNLISFDNNINQKLDTILQFCIHFLKLFCSIKNKNNLIITLLFYILTLI